MFASIQLRIFYIPVPYRKTLRQSLPSGLYGCETWSLTLREEPYIEGEIWGSHGGENVDVGLLNRTAVWTCRWTQMFQRNILPPSSALETTYLRNAGVYLQVHMALQPRRCCVDLRVGSEALAKRWIPTPDGNWTQIVQSVAGHSDSSRKISLEFNGLLVLLEEKSSCNVFCVRSGRLWTVGSMKEQEAWSTEVTLG
jgi:hypothetical protein